MEQYGRIAFEAAAVCGLWQRGPGEPPKKGLRAVILVLLLSGAELHQALTKWRASDNHNGASVGGVPLSAMIDFAVGMGEAVGATAFLWRSARKVEKGDTIRQGIAFCLAGFLAASVLAMLGNMSIAVRASSGRRW